MSGRGEGRYSMGVILLRYTGCTSYKAGGEINAQTECLAFGLIMVTHSDSRHILYGGRMRN